MSDPKSENIRRGANLGVVTKARDWNTRETEIVKKKDLFFKKFSQANKVSHNILSRVVFEKRCWNWLMNH